MREKCSCIYRRGGKKGSKIKLHTRKREGRRKGREKERIEGILLPGITAGQ